MRSLLLPLLLLLAECSVAEPQKELSVEGSRVELPLVFQQDGDVYNYKQSHPLHTLWFKLESSLEDEAAFQRGFNRAIDGSAPRIRELDVATLAPIYQLVAANELNAFFIKNSYDFIIIQDRPEFLPEHPEYANRCAYLGYRVVGHTSAKHPDTVFVTREHSVVCVRRDEAAENLKIDQITMSERWPDHTEPCRDFDELADTVFSSLRPY